MYVYFYIMYMYIYIVQVHSKPSLKLLPQGGGSC